MQNKSELHLVVPGICGPLAETRSLKTSRIIDRWVKTLSRSHFSPLSGNTDDVITSILKLKFNDDFPSAALTLMANGMYDPAMFYMHADPVHLRADMDHAVLTSSADLNISDPESVALCDMLNQHFKQDGLTFLMLNKDQWFVSSKDKISINTTPLTDAAGRNVNFILPDGEDATRWKQILTEAQMLMHSHEVNASRENSGSMSINSLWFHGSGELTDAEVDTAVSLCSNHDMLQGLASSIKCDYMKMPVSVNGYAEYLVSCQRGSLNVLHIAELEHLVNYTDVRPWLNKLAEILDHWIYPLIIFTNKNNIKMTLYPCDDKKYLFSKYDALKFWRKQKLEKHVNCY